MQRLRRLGPGKYEAVELPMPSRDDIAGKSDLPQLVRVTCTILDMRAPEQVYVCTLFFVLVLLLSLSGCSSALSAGVHAAELLHQC
jgi:hypothetical protein